MVHDLGEVLSGDQRIDHAFVLENRGDQPVHDLAVSPLSPCCSEVVSAPDRLAPGEAAEVVVRFMPRHQAGRRILTFTLTYVCHSTYGIDLNLVATLVPGREVLPLQPDPVTTEAGEEAIPRFRFIERSRQWSSGLEAVYVESSLGTAAASIVSRNELTDDLAGLSRREYVVDLRLPARLEEGEHVEEITLRSSASGEPWRHPVRQRVIPLVRFSPSAFFVTGEDSEIRTLTVQASDQTFQIVGVEAENEFVELESPLPTAASKRHVIPLRIDTSKLAPRRAYDLVVLTNHAIQPKLRLSVMKTSKN